MSRRQIVLVAVLALVALIVVWLALGTRRAPYLPEDADHGDAATTSCLDCHGPDGGFPRPANHPLGNDCFRCHARR